MPFSYEDEYGRKYFRKLFFKKTLGERETIVLEEGDIALDEDGKIYFGDGTTTGGTELVTGAGSAATLGSFSVSTQAAGTAALGYNSSTGVFTYTPPDLSSYTTSAGLNTAIDNHINVSGASNNQVLSWNGSDYAWVANSGGGGGGIALTDLSVGAEGSASGDGAIAYNNTTGVFTYTPPDLSGYLTSYTETQSLDDVVALGDTTARAVTINNTLTVNDIASTGVGFATMTSASDIVLNPAGEVNVSTSKIVNVVDPTNDQEAATKKYVDDAIANSEPAFNITAPNSGIYRFAAGSAGFPAQADNPTIYLYRGLVYHFNINAAGHPFYINTVNGTGTGNAYNAGVTNNGTQSGVIRFEVPMDAPQTLYYNCQYHGAMNGTIVITP